jgi:hypothetical protein
MFVTLPRQRRGVGSLASTRFSLPCSGSSALVFFFLHVIKSTTVFRFGTQGGGGGLEAGDWSVFLARFSPRFRRCLCVLPKVFDDEKKRQQERAFWAERDRKRDREDFVLASSFYSSPIDVMRAIKGIRGGRDEVAQNRKQKRQNEEIFSATLVVRAVMSARPPSRTASAASSPWKKTMVEGFPASALTKIRLSASGLRVAVFEGSDFWSAARVAGGDYVPTMEAVICLFPLLLG